MSVLHLLSTNLNRRDELPNQELASKIAAANDKKTIKEIAANLNHPDKNIQGDCIKVLAELGVENPALIKEYTEVVGNLRTQLQTQINFCGTHRNLFIKKFQFNRLTFKP